MDIGITKEFEEEVCCQCKTVQKLMRKMGIFCRVRMHKYNSYKGDVGRIPHRIFWNKFQSKISQNPEVG